MTGPALAPCMGRAVGAAPVQRGLGRPSSWPGIPPLPLSFEFLCNLPVTINYRTPTAVYTTATPYA